MAIREKDYDPKNVHMVRCPFCNEYHRFRLMMTTVGQFPLPDNLEDLVGPVNEMIESSPVECPITKQTFTADEWLHLTQDEFHQRFPGTRSN